MKRNIWTTICEGSQFLPCVPRSARQGLPGEARGDPSGALPVMIESWGRDSMNF